MVTHARMAPVAGLAMGAMAPAMAHGPLAAAGLAFVAAHVVAGLGLAALALLVPALRGRALRHRPDRATAGRMAGGVALGFGTVCAHCVLTAHGTA